MRSALGKGLSALISEETAATVAAQNTSPTTTISTLPISQVKPNPKQPRQTFSQESLQELAGSIKQRGILQPILVNPAADGTYEIIAGERRWRASQLAGLQEIPVIIKTNPESERFEIALIENVQREDLNPIDLAQGFLRLMDEFHLTQEEIAQIIGKDRAVVANTVRLLNLSEAMRDAMIQGQMSSSHGRALVAIEDPVAREALFKRIIEEQLPVRAVEEAVRAHKQVTVRGHVRGTGASPKDREVRALEHELQHALSRKVEFQLSSPSSQKGWIKLEFYSLDDLDRLVAQLKKTAK